VKNPKLKVVSTRVTGLLARAIEEYLRIDAHVSPADFIRDAIREKLKNDVPELYQKMLQKEMEEIHGVRKPPRTRTIGQRRRRNG